MARQVGESNASPGLALRHSAATTSDGVESPGTTVGCRVDTQLQEADGETKPLFANLRERRTAGSMMNVAIGSVPG